MYIGCMLNMKLLINYVLFLSWPGLNVLDDDSGKLGEIVELFSHFTLPLKVEKLIKVSPPLPSCHT